MILDEQGMNRAKSLASEIVKVNKEREIAMIRKESMRRASNNSFEALGRTIRKAQNAYIEGFIKPINNAMESMRKGFYS